MTMINPNTRFCSVCARQAGLKPAGYGGAAYHTIIAAELPLPWPQAMFADPAHMPPEVLAVMQQLRAVQSGRVYAVGQYWFSGNILAAHAILDDLERYLLTLKSPTPID